MTIKISQPPFNLREKLADLRKPSGIAGEAMLRAETPQEQFNLIGAGRKNVLINGGFDIWQRAGSFSNVNNVFTADHWYFSSSSNGSIAKGADADYGSTAQITVNSTVSSFIQPVENINGFLKNKKATLSFLVKSSTITSAHMAVKNATNTTTYKKYDVSDTWRRVEISFFTGTSYSSGNTLFLHLLHNTNATGMIEFA